jgi:hypothetical protein
MKASLVSSKTTTPSPLPAIESMERTVYWKIYGYEGGNEK